MSKSTAYLRLDCRDDSIQVRERTGSGKTTIEVVRGIASLPSGRAVSRGLLELARRHWRREHRPRYVRDVTPGEEACPARSGSAPQVLAAQRNATIHVLRAILPGNIAAATKHLLAKPREALRLVVASG